MMNSKKKAGLLIFFGLLLLLLNKPVVSVSSGLFLGVPGPIFYIGFVWIAVIVIMYFISARTKNES